MSLQARRERGAEMAGLYAPMNRSLSEICSSLIPEQFPVIRDFLRDAANAGSDAAADLRAAD